MIPAPALDLTTSLRGDLQNTIFHRVSLDCAKPLQKRQRMGEPNLVLQFCLLLSFARMLGELSFFRSHAYAD